MSTALTTLPRDFNGHAFVFREDGWFNMTKAAKHFGKRIQDFWDNKDTKEYILALCKTIHANQRELFLAKAGYNGGTWAHPKLAVFFARWLDVKFAVWCDAMIDDILKGQGHSSPWRSARGGHHPAPRVRRPGASLDFRVAGFPISTAARGKGTWAHPQKFIANF